MESSQQKPVKLYKDIIQSFSNDPSLYVFDYCSGTASCAVACSALKRNRAIFEKSNPKATLIQRRFSLNDE